MSLVLSQESNLSDFSVDWHFLQGILPTAPVHLHTALLWAAGSDLLFKMCTSNVTSALHSLAKENNSVCATSLV